MAKAMTTMTVRVRHVRLVRMVFSLLVWLAPALALVLGEARLFALATWLIGRTRIEVRRTGGWREVGRLEVIEEVEVIDG